MGATLGLEVCSWPTMAAWHQLTAQGFAFNHWSTPASYFFYIITGLHAAHLIVGVIALAVTLDDSQIVVELRQIAVDATAWYWHAMGLAWMVLFAVLVITVNPEPEVIEKQRISPDAAFLRNELAGLGGFRDEGEFVFLLDAEVARHPDPSPSTSPHAAFYPDNRESGSGKREMPCPDTSLQIPERGADRVTPPPPEVTYSTPLRSNRS